MKFRQQMRALISAIVFIAARGPLLIAARAQSSAATQSSSTNANAHLSDEQIPASLYANLQWRCIGPFRGGRTVAAHRRPRQTKSSFTSA